MISLPQSDRGIASDQSRMAGWRETALLLCSGDSPIPPLSLSLSLCLEHLAKGRVSPTAMGPTGRGPVRRC